MCHYHSDVIRGAIIYLPVEKDSGKAAGVTGRLETT
jgi:hypothetical protein